jgi:hypothetical protein|tara:strand:+ start:2339 stop:2992 length:654 start_codon:yes stop_codon:yes gene_type:complete
MGYLDNSSITVDAILTKKGRELLSRNDGSFNITSFALADDEIDYSLYNENHPNGSQYAGEAIENMPILEAFPDENNIMLHKLITLNRNITTIPTIITTNKTPILTKGGASGILNPITKNYDSTVSQIEPRGYLFTVADRRLFSNFSATGQGIDTSNTSNLISNQVAVSETVIGNSLTFTPISSDSLFGTNTQLLTTIAIEGRDTGARTTITITLNKN